MHHTALRHAALLRTRLAWSSALALALLLHAGVFWLLQHTPRPAFRPNAASSAFTAWQVRRIYLPTPDSFASPIEPASPAAPQASLTPRAFSPPRPATALQPLSPAEPILSPVPPTHTTIEPDLEPASPAFWLPPTPAAPKPPAHRSSPVASAPMQWLDANHADTAPVPIGEHWMLADMPWPPAHPSVQLRLWISAQGRIERFELLGPAAGDPAMQRLFEPLADTPMQPARLGSVPVPSTMLVQMWPGMGSAPDYVLPLPTR